MKDSTGVPSAASIQLLPDGHNSFGGKQFVAHWNGERVGIVWQMFPTFERKAKGRMYVNSRWTSKTPHWKSQLDGGRFSRLFYRTKRQAIEVLARDLAQGIEARRAATSGAVHESPVGTADAPKLPQE